MDTAMLALLLLALASTVLSWSDDSALRLVVKPVTPSSQPRFEVFDFTVDMVQGDGLTVPWESVVKKPFDYSTFNLSATVSGPAESGKTQTWTLDVFWYQNFTVEHTQPLGPPGFRVRFTATEVGAYTLKASYDERVESNVVSFKATDVDEKKKKDFGFARVSSVNGQYFALDGSDTSLFLLGENLCWSTQSTVGSEWLAAYERWMERLNATGANYGRLWLGPFDEFSFETKETGLRNYSLPALWRLEYVLRLGLFYDVRFMVTLDSFNSYRSVQPFPAWGNSPYNVENGGFLKSAELFFSDARARATWLNRFRYLNARFSGFTAVFAWELFNEVDLTDNALANAANITDWHKVQAQAIRALDPHKHPISTSFSFSPGVPQIDSLPELDFTQTHNYNAKDAGATIPATVLLKSLSYQKPTYFGEFGIEWPEVGKVDPKALDLHNGAFASIASGAAGMAMTWWWDLYIDPQNLYGALLDGPAAFVQGIEWHKMTWKHVDSSQLAVVSGSVPKALRTVALLGNDTASKKQVAIVWLQNSNNTWSLQQPSMNGTVPLHPTPPLVWELRDIMPGVYDAQWFDTRTGAVLDSHFDFANSTKVNFESPQFTTDIACRVVLMKPYDL